MPQVPQPLMRRHQTLDAAPSVAVRGIRAAGEHAFQNVQQLLGHVEIGLVAGVVEGDQDFVGQPPTIARRARAGGFPCGVVAFTHVLVRPLFVAAVR